MPWFRYADNLVMACRDVPEGQRDYLWVPPAPRYHVGSHE
jgi:hypothetical protein